MGRKPLEILELLRDAHADSDKLFRMIISTDIKKNNKAFDLICSHNVFISGEEFEEFKKYIIFHMAKEIEKFKKHYKDGAIVTAVMAAVFLIILSFCYFVKKTFVPPFLIFSLIFIIISLLNFLLLQRNKDLP